MMTEQEKTIAKGFILREQWYKSYVALLVKAFDIPQTTADTLVKVSKPEFSDEQMEQAFNEVYQVAVEQKPIVEETEADPTNE